MACLPLARCHAMAMVTVLFMGAAAVRDQSDARGSLNDLGIETQDTSGPSKPNQHLEMRNREARVAGYRRRMLDVKERAEEKQKERQRIEEELQKKEQHMLENKRDCEWAETWGDFGACSASCGGGVSPKRLLKRWVTQPPDKFNYGQPCPHICEGSDCTEEVTQSCSHEPCPSDCSVVDLGNVLPTTGTALAWQGGALDCVYQFWHVEGKALKLLGETYRQGVGASPFVHIVDKYGPKQYTMMLKPDDKRRVVLGFRSCREPVPLASPSGPTPNVAKVCLWGGKGYQDHSQNRDLSNAEQKALLDYRNDVPPSEYQRLFREAVPGVSDSTPGVTFEGDPQEAPAAGYTLRAILADKIPPGPVLSSRDIEVDERGGLRLKIFNSGPHGDGVVWKGRHVFARRVFTSHLFGKKGKCEWQLVPKCQEGQEVPCVEEDLTLRHFFPGSSLLVKVNCENAAGHVRNTFEEEVKFGVKVGTPWEQCPVDHWESMRELNEALEEVNPEAGAPQCRFDTPPVLPCRMTEKKDRRGNLKCIGKKYWQTFRPVDDSGSTFFPSEIKIAYGAEKHDFTDCAFMLPGICTHEPKLEEEEKVRKCDLPGCGTSMFTWLFKTCCCYPGKAGEEDCACTSEKCESLGLVKAADAKKSCRH